MSPRMTDRTWRWVAGMVILATAIPIARADDPRLGTRYRNPMQGFSLRPPAGGVIERGGTGSFLIAWRKTDAKTGEMLWDLRVYRSGTSGRKIDPTKYIRELADVIEKAAEGTKIVSSSLKTVAGKPAMDFTGRRTNTADRGAGGRATVHSEMWFRQVWIVTGDTELLGIKVSAPPKQSEKVRSLFGAVLESVELSDPAKARAERKAFSERSVKLLWGERRDPKSPPTADSKRGITGAKIASILPTKPQWMLLKYRERYVGWTCMQGEAHRRDGTSGYVLRTWSMWKPPGKDIRIVRQTLFTDPKLSMETWREHWQVGEGKDAPVMVEDGIRQLDLIFATIMKCRRESTLKKNLTGPVQLIYVPRILGQLLPRWIDLKTKSGYVFAVLNSNRNDFDTRTIRVVGPEAIDLRGRKTPAIKLLDQSSGDAEETTTWVDSTGRVLLSRMPDGVQIESATRDDVLKSFPKAEALILQLVAAEAKTPKYIHVGSERD